MRKYLTQTPKERQINIVLWCQGLGEEDKVVAVLLIVAGLYSSYPIAFWQKQNVGSGVGQVMIPHSSKHSNTHHQTSPSSSGYLLHLLAFFLVLSQCLTLKHWLTWLQIP